MAVLDRKSVILVDAHVHIHACFDINDFFCHASDNFGTTRKEKKLNPDGQNVLLLTESRNTDYFKKLKHWTNAFPKEDTGFEVRMTNEDDSLLVELKDGSRLFVIAGRQIVTAERLEVLAIGTGVHFSDGEPIRRVIQNVVAGNALVVLPWGFGKWLGRRGNIIDELIADKHREYFFLGDNSGRPAFLPSPRQFIKAQQRNIPVLPGSDPLPFASEQWRAGSFGFFVTGMLTDSTPTEDLKQIIRQNASTITPYGKLENPLRFLRNQFAMQLVKQKY